MKNISKWTISHIHPGRGGREHILYAELRDEHGQLQTVGTLEYIFNKVHILCQVPQPREDDGGWDEGLGMGAMH